MFALGIVTKFASFVFLVLACYLYKLPPDTSTPADPTSTGQTPAQTSDSNHLPVAMTELPSQNVHV